MDTAASPNAGVGDWPTAMARLLTNAITNANIVAWNWRDAAISSWLDPKQAGSQTPQQGTNFGVALLTALGPNYSKQIHFIGHSFGTLVNAYAANFLQGNHWAAEPVSPTPWPATNMLMTLFDEAEVGADKNFNLNSQDIQLLLAREGFNNNYLNYLNSSSPYYHPLPKQFAWSDNYVSAFGLLHTNAANAILTNGFPTDAPDLKSWLIKLVAFHNYPFQWYEETIQTSNSPMGFTWSFLWQVGDPAFANAPSNGSVYVQAFKSSPWDLTETNWNYGTNLVDQRFKGYLNELPVWILLAQIAGNTWTATGNVLGQLLQVPNTPDFNTIINLVNSPAPSATSAIRPHPLGQPADNENSANVPAYAWAQLIVPANAVSMSFDYIIQGDWQSDSLAAAFNGTNVLLIAGNTIQTNITFSSGSIDVSDFAGQTNEFFIGIVGGTSTNAQLTVENLVFSISLPPSLQAQMGGGNLMLSWPMSAQDFSLQTTTNLADPNSWVTLTNVPAIVNLQNAVTNPVSAGAQFYRLKQ